MSTRYHRVTAGRSHDDATSNPNTVQLRVRAVVLGYASFWLGEAGF